MDEPTTNDETEQHRTERSRRSVLAGLSGAMAGVGGMLAGVRTASAEEVCPIGVTHDSFTIRDGSQYRTRVYVNESAFVGPTVVIIGGVHGDEPAGAIAAHRILDWEFDCGRLVVIPEANVPALAEGSRSSPSGDLNRQFPPSQAPETPLAEDLWDVIASVDPDAVIDLHTSRGIWQSDEEPGGYGQAIFATQDEEAPAAARETVGRLNDRYIDDSYLDSYRFRAAATISGDRPLLVHKVTADLGVPGYITEATRYETEFEDRVAWTKAMVTSLLSEHGIETEYAF